MRRDYVERVSKGEKDALAQEKDDFTSVCRFGAF